MRSITEKCCPLEITPAGGFAASDRKSLSEARRSPSEAFWAFVRVSYVRDSPKANEGNSGAQRMARLDGALNTGCPWLQFVHFGENICLYKTILSLT